MMDFQHYAHNDKLERLIKTTIKQYEEQNVIPDDLLDVSAAGDPTNIQNDIKKEAFDGILSEKQK